MAIVLEYKFHELMHKPSQKTILIVCNVQDCFVELRQDLSKPVAAFDVILVVIVVGDWMFLLTFDWFVDENVNVSTLDFVSLEIESSRSNCGKSTDVRCAESLWYIDKSVPFFELLAFSYLICCCRNIEFFNRS